MKPKTLMSAAVLFILASQPSFGWTRMQTERIWQGGWTYIRIPVAPMSFTCYVPFRQSWLLEQGQFSRDDRHFDRERRSFNDRNYRFNPKERKPGRIRLPKW
jgi:hypothetical protein